MDSSAIYISYVITEIFCIFFSVGIIVKSNKNVGTDLPLYFIIIPAAAAVLEGKLCRPYPADNHMYGLYRVPLGCNDGESAYCSG